MPVISATLLRQPLHFPCLLPKQIPPHPIPVPRKRVYAHLNAVRDLQREMDDLSDEENELEDIVCVFCSVAFAFHYFTLLICACRRQRYIIEDIHFSFLSENP